jgi:hypothetical protein
MTPDSSHHANANRSAESKAAAEAHDHEHEMHREKLRQKSKLQGRVADLSTPSKLAEAIDDAFAYRGDVAILKADGEVVVGFLFDRRLTESSDGVHPLTGIVRLLVRDDDDPVVIDVADIDGLKFTGRDFGTGIGWDLWEQKNQSDDPA